MMGSDILNAVVNEGQSEVCVRLRSPLPDRTKPCDVTLNAISVKGVAEEVTLNVTASLQEIQANFKYSQRWKEWNSEYLMIMLQYMFDRSKPMTSQFRVPPRIDIERVAGKCRCHFFFPVNVSVATSCYEVFRAVGIPKDDIVKYQQRDGTVNYSYSPEVDTLYAIQSVIGEWRNTDDPATSYTTELPGDERSVLKTGPLLLHAYRTPVPQAATAELKAKTSYYSKMSDILNQQMEEFEIASNLPTTARFFESSNGVVQVGRSPTIKINAPRVDLEIRHLLPITSSVIKWEFEKSINLNIKRDPHPIPVLQFKYEDSVDTEGKRDHLVSPIPNYRFPISLISSNQKSNISALNNEGFKIGLSGGCLAILNQKMNVEHAFPLRLNDSLGDRFINIQFVDREGKEYKFLTDTSIVMTFLFSHPVAGLLLLLIH